MQQVTQETSTSAKTSHRQKNSTHKKPVCQYKAPTSQHSSASRNFEYIFTISTSDNLFAVPTISSDTMLTFIAAATKRQSQHLHITLHGHSINFDASPTCCMFLTSLPKHAWVSFTLFQFTTRAQLHSLPYLHDCKTLLP